jgi:predicted DNA-binding transcriptional regulator AlpA
MRQCSLTPELRLELSNLSIAEFLKLMSGQGVPLRPDTDVLLSRKQAAHYLSISISYIRKLEAECKGPKMLRMGPRVLRYRVSDLDAWRDAHASKR